LIFAIAIKIFTLKFFVNENENLRYQHIVLMKKLSDFDLGYVNGFYNIGETPANYN
jgi:hypothetical protein